MSAWRLDSSPRPDDAPRRELFSCADCLPPPAKRVDGYTRDPGKQRRRLCVLPGFDCSEHDPAPKLPRVWMGRGRDLAREGKASDWAAPCEPIADMGCPGAWYRTPFMRSLDRYYRRRTEGGGRVENPALARCDDPLVLEAIQTLEAHEDAAHAEHMRRHYAAQAEKHKARSA